MSGKRNIEAEYLNTETLVIVICYLEFAVTSVLQNSSSSLPVKSLNSDRVLRRSHYAGKDQALLWPHGAKRRAQNEKLSMSRLLYMYAMRHALCAMRKAQEVTYG